MIQLEELLIDGNKIKVLPNFLGKFSKLKHLDASFNQLEVICSEIGNCSNLVDLTLSSNDLKVGQTLEIWSLISKQSVIEMRDGVGNILLIKI